MNYGQWLGQVLLWAGFLTAALATVAYKEIDLLPPEEQASLKKLDEGLVIPKAELQQLIERPIAEMRAHEIEAMVERLNAWHQQRNAEIEQLTRQKQTIPPVIHPQRKWDIIARRTAVLDNVWSTIAWPWYGFAMMMGIVGVVIFRSTKPTGVIVDGSSRDGYTVLTESLNSLIKNIGLLKDRFEQMIPEEVVEFIDDQCALHFSDFADARHALVQRYGLTGFAEIMSDFALGERLINRAWCASADGYMEEADQSIAKALQHLKSAQDILRQRDQDLGAVS